MSDTVMTSWQGVLRKRSACSEAVRFAEGFDSFQAAWNACERGDWMLWWIGKTIAREQGDERKRLVRVACQCARLALPFVKDGEARPLKAIETAERWANSDPAVTLDKVRAANAVANAAYNAVNAANAAANAAYDAANAAYARAKVLKQCADLVRAEYPTPPEATR